MEDYKVANRQKYYTTDERAKFETQPSKIIGVESFRRRCKYIAAPDECLLDIGGGAGIWVDILREEGLQNSVFALDISQAMLQERQREDIGIVGDMEALPFHDERFDRVLFFASLHHVWNTRQALHEAFRVVKPGGHLVFCEPISVRLLLLGRDIEQIKGNDVEFCFSVAYLLRLMKEIGLSVVYTHYRGIFRRFLPSHSSVTLLRICDHLDDILNRLPAIRRAGILGDHLTLVAQKCYADKEP